MGNLYYILLLPTVTNLHDVVEEIQGKLQLGRVFGGFWRDAAAAELGGQ